MDEIQVDTDEAVDLGIVRVLGDLPPDAIISEGGLAKIFSRHRVSIKRAIERGELPPPVRLFGSPVWTVQVLRDHMACRLEVAKKEAERTGRRISQLGA